MSSLLFNSHYERFYINVRIIYVHRVLGDEDPLRKKLVHMHRVCASFKHEEESNEDLPTYDISFNIVSQCITYVDYLYEKGDLAGGIEARGLSFMSVRAAQTAVSELFANFNPERQSPFSSKGE